MLNFIMQEGVDPAIQELEPEVTEKTLSIMELLMNGGVGGQVIIGVLFVLLFVAVYIYFERVFAIKSGFQDG
jgi:outer membrane transport energization protein ExbB (TC 2.C.1.1.1)